jgi:predicted GIY-YIG superfamily endonuclease
MTFYYVYILQSVKYPDKYHTGFAENLDSRFKDHNNGKCQHTLKYMPWRIKTAIAFTNRKKAVEFEHYLKSQSGRAFAKKRL